MQRIWNESSHSHVKIDSLLNTNENIRTAMTSMRSRQENEAVTHLFSLSMQGMSIKTVTVNIQKTTVSIWSEVLNSLPQYLFNFARKALLQQLPTAGNLYRWEKVDSPNCGLCKSGEQSNKHVLSHCSATCSLTRCTSRHDKILDILAQWLTSVKTNGTSLFADVSSGLYSKIDNVFEPVCRPDVVLVKKSRVFVLELTVCHESNLLKSKLYKLNKYENIKHHLKPEHSHSTVELFTLEISVLGFVSDLSEFWQVDEIAKITYICL